MRRSTFLLLLCIFTGTGLYGQAFIKMSQPVREEINTATARQYIVGRTCKGCRVRLNNDSIYVYPTGVFAMKKELQPGKTTFFLTAEAPDGNVYTRIIKYYFNPPPPLQPTATFRIEYATVFPTGNLQVSAGDTLRVKMKAYPGCTASWINNTPLQEMSPAENGGVAGFYEGLYVVQAADSLLDGRLTITLKDNAGNTTAMQSTYRYTYLRNQLLTGRTIDNLTYLTTSPHGDRLGPEKAGYLDKDVLLHIAGREGDFYKVKLSSRHFAYIPEPLVDTATLAEPEPMSIVHEASVWSDDRYDYVSVGLSDKLPYLSTQETAPGRITVDIYGAYSEPGFVPSLKATAEISRVSWQQVEPDVFRIVIALEHGQPWGYQVYYTGNRLTIKVKRPPARLELKGLTIGIDAGHGGSNVGALGAAGIYEKQLSLSLSLLLQAALEKEGARVLMTRTTDKFVANEDRLSYYRRANPDLLLSIHLNSSVNPVDIKGTATYYKHPFCEPLGRSIHQRLLEAGLHDFGNNGNFNFVLNNPTEFPNVLVETLFLSNPEDEMRILDEQFRRVIAEKIVQGLKDFLRTAGK